MDFQSFLKSFNKDNYAQYLVTIDLVDLAGGIRR